VGVKVGLITLCDRLYASWTGLDWTHLSPSRDTHWHPVGRLLSSYAMRLALLLRKPTAQSATCVEYFLEHAPTDTQLPPSKTSPHSAGIRRDAFPKALDHDMLYRSLLRRVHLATGHEDAKKRTLAGTNRSPGTVQQRSVFKLSVVKTLEGSQRG
jgi:hypothetical protein